MFLSCVQFVGTGDVGFMKIRGRNDHHIVTGHAALGATIHERTLHRRRIMVGYMIIHCMGVATSIKAPCDVDNSVSRRWLHQGSGNGTIAA
jgi:hypothetical protein